MRVNRRKENPVDLKGFLEKLEIELGDNGEIFWKADFDDVLSEIALNNMKMFDAGVCGNCNTPRDQFGCACSSSVHFLKGDCVPVELFVSAWFVKKDGGRELKRHDFERILGEENGALIYYNKFSELGYKVALEDRFLFKEIAEVTVSLKNPKGKAREDENWRHLKADARKTFE